MPEAETSPANFRYFLLGVFTTVCVLCIFAVGGRLFFYARQGGPPIITGEQDLSTLMQTDVNLFWRLVPNVKNKQVTEVLAIEDNTPSTYVYSTNELGFRSPPLKLRRNQFRILAIGDSTTFGQHLSDSETWPAQLQELLDPGAEQVEVINAGVIGASSFQGLAFLNTRGLALEPDLVIATFGFNDWASADLSDRERACAYQRRGLAGMVDLIIHPRKSRSEVVQRATPGEYLDHMTAIARLCEENAIPVVFLIWPNPFEVKTPLQNMSAYRPLLIEVCRTTRAHCLDLLPAFQNATEPVFLDWIHATRKGCAVVTQALATFIAEQQWLTATKITTQ